MEAKIEPTVELDLPLKADVTLGKDPVPCYDHDHPEFSNPGSADQVDDVRLSLKPKQLDELMRLGHWRAADRHGVAPFATMSHDDVERFLWDALCIIFPSINDEKELEGRFIEQAAENAKDADYDGE